MTYEMGPQVLEATIAAFNDKYADRGVVGTLMTVGDLPPNLAERAAKNGYRTEVRCIRARTTLSAAEVRANNFTTFHQGTPVFYETNYRG